MWLRYGRNQREVEYYEDCVCIVRALARHCGIVVSIHDAEKMWEEYSSLSCARWLILPESEEELIDILVEK